MKRDNNFAAIICAAGCSSRMGGLKKEYCPAPNTDKTVLGMAVSAFIGIPCISTIVITVPASAENGEAAARRALPPGLPEAGGLPKIVFAQGGKTRRASVQNALLLLREYQPGYVLIHDGSRPWISPQLILRVAEAVQRHGAVIPALPLVGTPKETAAPLEAAFAEGLEAEPVYVTRHLRRSHTVIAQTPQAFAFAQILSAHEKAAEKENQGMHEYTDDAEVWGEFCGPVAVIPGEPENRKITFPEDLKVDSHGGAA